MNWEKDFVEACQYSKAVNGLLKKEKVDNETLYHIICLSVEKYSSTLTGMLNYIPMHSGLTFIFRELGRKINLPVNFLKEVTFLNSFMVYCSLDFVKPRLISREDITRMVFFMEDLRSFTSNTIKSRETINYS